MLFHEHYGNFIRENNVVNILLDIKTKKRTRRDLVLIMVFLIVSLFLVIMISSRIGKDLDLIYYILFFSCMLTLYIIIIANKMVRANALEEKIPHLRISKFNLIFFDIDWQDIRIKYYWFEELSKKYREIPDELILLYKNSVDTELSKKTIPKFTYPSIQNMASLTSLLYLFTSSISVMIGITTERGKYIFIMSIILVIFPLIYTAFLISKSYYDYEKSTYQSMINYSDMLKYILEKRKIQK
ncbi:hypothetical protein PG593_04440 [Riemerella anatipestifer]|nr:hypothetical protein [Riemerella anatipestifer]MDY3357408.1 hypothetical protein [Riemerella anatipestifer]MDY3529024.1 hypothetical protein [Riemerella anatipestifer]